MMQSMILEDNRQYFLADRGFLWEIHSVYNEMDSCSHPEMPPDVHCGFCHGSMKREAQKLYAPLFAPTQGLAAGVACDQRASREAAQCHGKIEGRALYQYI